MLALLASGCASWTRYVPSQEGYRRTMASWEGQPADDLVRKWGPPRATVPMGNGHLLYLYRETSWHQQEGHSSTRVDANGQTFTSWEPPRQWTTHCDSQFEVAEGRIRSWRYEGGDCRATYDDTPQPVTTVQSSWVGAHFTQLSPEVAERLHLASPRGVLVVSVVPNAPAAVGGLSALDVVTAIDGQPVEQPTQAAEVIASRPVGSTITFEVQRGPEARHVRVALVARPAN